MVLSLVVLAVLVLLAVNQACLLAAGYKYGLHYWAYRYKRLMQ